MLTVDQKIGVCLLMAAFLVPLAVWTLDRYRKAGEQIDAELDAVRQDRARTILRERKEQDAQTSEFFDKVESFHHDFD